jgi:uncharacterized protein (TIGR02466 family)
MITPIFSVPLYTETGVDISGVSEHLQTLEYKRVGSDNGYGTLDQQIFNHPELQGLHQQVLSHIGKYVTELQVDPNVQFYVNCSWGVYHNKGDWAHSHDHNNSLLSGVVYIDVDDDSGSLSFHKDWQTLFPNAICPSFTGDNVFNSNQAMLTPVSGEIVIFPSHVMHSVSESKSDKTRRCVAFNVFAKGIINDGSDYRFSALEL